AEAGQPVLLVVGDREYFDADDEEEEPEQIGITPLGTSFAINPMTSGGAHGTYTYQWVDEGTVVVGGGKIGKAGNTLVLAEGKENTDCTRDVSANTGYIVYGENILKNASVDDFDLVITAGKPIARGDVNCDGTVDIADAVSVLNAMAGQQVQGVADVNGDGEVDIADLVTVLNIMAGQ
ncbi:MAG: dockerin type I repeat-containing protein, partial [Bacteroidaceae bacterium]|nr:dockerin type I repeat-containing protein [Bacteroidaceae bacterium]